MSVLEEEAEIGAERRPPPDVELVVLAGRRGPEEDERIRRICRGPVDWDAALRVATRHQLAPVLRARLEALQVELPTAIATRLREVLHWVGRRNLHLTSHLAEMLGEWEERGVRAVPLKGPVLASAIYESPALRVFSDLDILVESVGGLRIAHRSLLSRGFRPVARLTPGQDLACRLVWYAYGYRREEDGVDVELHWRLAPACFPLRGARTRLWRNTRRTSLHGTSVAALRPDWLLLTLCIHGAKSEPPWSKLKWVLDVAELARSAELDWPFLVEEARETGCLGILHLGLRLARDLFAVETPEAVRASMPADSAIPDLARELRERLLFGGAEEPVRGRLGWELSLRERRVDRALTVLGRILLPGVKDVLAVPLPRALLPLYVPVRLARLAGRLLSQRTAPAASPAQ